MQASIENSIKTPFRASEFEENPLRAHDRKKKFYISNAKQKTMEKRNDILLFVQDRATRENNIKGRIDLRDFGALTVGDSISLWESDFITKDEDGDTVEMSGHCVYDKVQENGQWGTFWVGETKYTFTGLETIALDRYELYDAFPKAYRRGEMHAKNALEALKKDAETSKMSKKILSDVILDIAEGL